MKLEREFKNPKIKLSPIWEKKYAAQACVIFLCFIVSGQVIAAPEEIEVYLDDFTEIGKYALDLHTNYVVDGQSQTNHQFRLTPELSYGINSNWEVAGYILTEYNSGSAQTDGIKIRAKWRPNEPVANTFYWAINTEIGQLSKQYFPDETSGEIKLIGVWRSNPWVIGVNVNYGHSLNDHPILFPTIEIDSTIVYQIKEGLQIAIESYSFPIALQKDPNQIQANNSNYLVADFDMGKWSINAGIGHVSGQSSDCTVLKAIIGVPLY